MGDVSTLGLLKNALLFPLIRTRTSAEVTEATHANATSVVSVHDNHNIEIKTITELAASPSLVETEIFLFVPKNFELSAFGKQELITDVRSRVRLALPLESDKGSTAFEQSLKSLQTHLASLCDSGTQMSRDNEVNHALYESTLEAAKDLSVIVAETLKHRAMEQAREFVLSHTLLTIPKSAAGGLDKLYDKVNDTAVMVRKVRSVLENHSSSISSLLDEYISHLYIQYLGTIRTEIDRCPSPKVVDDDLTYMRSRNKVEEVLNSLQEDEALRRLRFGIRASDEETDLDRESRVVRLSHLKKFFQSKTFIEVTRRPAAKAISESTATIGTALAALLAALIETFARGALIANVAWQGLTVLSFGVILYVIRDRMKDRAKAVFHEKALKFLPDYEQRLVANNVQVGRVKEWFNILQSKHVPLDALALRHAAASTDMERRLPEDVFYCRKIQELDASPISGSASGGPISNSRALFENTRINFDRYLKHMDDAFKEFTDLDSNGKFTLGRSHRVYYFYLCVKTTSSPWDEKNSGRLLNPRPPRHSRRSQAQLYRIVLDKNGLVRLENMTH